MYDLTPMANGLLRKFSGAAEGWLETPEGIALVEKARALVATQDGEKVAEAFMDRVALIQATA